MAQTRQIGRSAGTRPPRGAVSAGRNQPRLPALKPGMGRRLAIAVALAAAGLAAASVWVLARPSAAVRVPAPVGPAANGLLLYGSNGSLVVQSGLGGRPRLILSGTDGSAQFEPLWSPDGQRFAFRLRTGDGSGLATAGADGFELAALPVERPVQVAWSPDSSELAVIDGTSPATLHVIAALGTADERINLGGLIPLSVAWRPPEGDSLLLDAMTLSGRRDLYLTDPLGLSVRPLHLATSLPTGPLIASGAIFSPDGQTIAFAALPTISPDEGRPQLWTMDVDGSDVRSLSAGANPAFVEAPVAFSPDGRWLLVRRWDPIQCCRSSAFESWLAIVPADGSAPPRDIGPHFLNVDSAVDPAFSPDGTKILVGARTTPPSVYVVDPGTGSFERLDWTDEVPAWQRIAP